MPRKLGKKDTVFVLFLALLSSSVFAEGSNNKVSEGQSKVGQAGGNALSSSVFEGGSNKKTTKSQSGIYSVNSNNIGQMKGSEVQEQAPLAIQCKRDQKPSSANSGSTEKGSELTAHSAK